MFEMKPIQYALLEMENHIYKKTGKRVKIAIPRTKEQLAKFEYMYTNLTK